MMSYRAEGNDYIDVKKVEDLPEGRWHLVLERHTFEVTQHRETWREHAWRIKAFREEGPFKQYALATHRAGKNHLLVVGECVVPKVKITIDF